MVDYLNRTTLDIIGLAGFNYPFNALDNDRESSELFSSLTKLRHVASDSRVYFGRFIVEWLKQVIPPLSIILRFTHLDQRARELESAYQGMIGILYQVLENGKKNLNLADDKTLASSLSTDYKEKSRYSKDILSAILRANAITSANGTRGLSDTELAHQIVTFLVVGTCADNYYAVCYVLIYYNDA
jgi:hypothetical protein